MFDEHDSLIEALKGAGLSLAGITTGLPIPVESSVIAAVSYDKMWGKLTIYFKSGREYEYSVSLATYVGLMTASSKGSYFNQFIKPTAPRKIGTGGQNRQKKLT